MGMDVSNVWIRKHGDLVHVQQLDSLFIHLLARSKGPICVDLGLKVGVHRALVQILWLGRYPIQSNIIANVATPSTPPLFHIVVDPKHLYPDSLETTTTNLATFNHQNHTEYGPVAWGHTRHRERWQSCVWRVRCRWQHHGWRIPRRTWERHEFLRKSLYNVSRVK